MTRMTDPVARRQRRRLLALMTLAASTAIGADGASAQTAAATPAPAAQTGPITPYAALRYRLEAVDQHGLAEDATASTLRLRAGIRTAAWHGLSAVVEGEAIARLGPAHYNDTVNGRAAYPIVADPSDVLLNQAYIRWQPDARVEATVGRQTVSFDNQRWVGAVDWRQNDQTQDAARLSLTPTTGTRIDYVHAWRVNRVFGPDSAQGIWRDNAIHLLRGSTTLAPLGTLTAYGYWLDLPDAPTLSSRTFGARLTGERPLGGGLRLIYAVEYARQRNHGPNPRRFDHDYALIEPGLALGPVSARVGYEHLGGDGTTALQTPLATLHAFNGWADRFLTTPANGLRDLYADVQWRLGPLLTTSPATLRFQLHDYRATRGDSDYGREVGAMLTLPIDPRLTATVKASRYAAESFASDTTKFWFSLDARF